MRTELRCHQCRHRYYRRPPRTAASPHVVTMIGASISVFYRRVAWFFTNLSPVATQNRRRLSFKGLGKLKFESDLKASGSGLRESETSILLPPLTSRNKRKTIFLDLDETLVHASLDPGPTGYDFIVRPIINGRRTKFYVLKRPGVEEFLGEMSKRYEVVVFTAALEEYAKLVVDRLDTRGELICHRLYREACGVVDRGRLVKDLSTTGREAGDVVIVDDNLNSYALQPENAIPISRFVCDGGDRDLEKVMGFLCKCDPSEDMRDVVKRYLNQTTNAF